MDPETRREVARKGGLAISKDRARMAALGRKGGAAMVAKYGSEHFKKLGAKGGAASRARRIERDGC